ncbi:MAG: FimB/Mfa2 family fimbrial subunit [Dysgonomonas sp.]|nr:FimB/Mfa2 family fimbrial subunit [Dysgonomonas sp.]
MKKLIYPILAVGLLLTACSSDQSGGIPDVEIPETKNVITINIGTDNNFQEIRSTEKRASLEEAGIIDLFYLVYNGNDGKNIKSRRYSGEDISNIKDTLPDGKYKIAIIATTTDYAFEPEPYWYEDFSRVFMPIGVMWKPTDYFYNHIDLDINQTTKDINISLERQTSKIEIIPTDINSIPNDVEAIIFRLKGLDFFEFKFSEKIVQNFRKSESAHSTIQKISREEFLTVSKDNPITNLVMALGAQTEFPLEAAFIKTGEKEPSAFVTLRQTYNFEKNKIYRFTGELFSKETNDGTRRAKSERLDWGESIRENFD